MLKFDAAWFTPTGDLRTFEQINLREFISIIEDEEILSIQVMRSGVLVALFWTSVDFIVYMHRSIPSHSSVWNVVALSPRKTK